MTRADAQAPLRSDSEQVLLESQSASLTVPGVECTIPGSRLRTAIGIPAVSADPALTSSESTQSEPGGKSEVPSHASFELRLAAGLVDALVLGAPAFLAICFVMGFDRCVESFLDILDAKEDAASRAIPAAQWLSGLVVAVITTLFWVHWSGRTPGKRVLGLRVVSYPG